VITARADHVGSLLRPQWLLDARARHAAGELSQPDFKAIEDRAVREAVALQHAAGMPIITDGEMRRESFQSELAAAVDGIEGATLGAWLWGDWHSDQVGDRSFERPADLAVTAPLRQRRSLASEEFVFLRSITDRVAKITLPSPSLFANLYVPERSGGAYPDLDAFLDEVTRILILEVRELERLGCRYIQLDAPHYPLLIDPAWRGFYESRGWPLERWLAHAVDLDNAVIDAAASVTFGFHLCRGNQASRWLVAGGYDPIAEPIFRRIHAHRLLLEYDDERSGSFEPLRHVRDDAICVLGLVTTKTPRDETLDWLEARVREANRYLPLDRLAIGTQCGFATSTLGNSISIADEERKLGRIAAAAERVWGG
jgi:5-methyltetrahydropteroyltriglutamate--homocysteine methyltransferase